MNNIIEHLSKNTDELLAFVAMLPDKHIHTTPPSGGWSIMQILDHLVTVDFGILSLMKTEGVAVVGERGSKDEQIILVGLNREIKVKAPTPLEPKGKTDSIDKFQNTYPTVRGKIITSLKDKDLDRLCDFFPHFVLGVMTFQEWLLFSIQHVNRHMLQMEEIVSELG